MTITDKIRQRALELLKENPKGIRYSELRRFIEGDNTFNSNTVNGAIWDLDAQLPDKVYKPSRGLFRLTKYRDTESDQLKPELVPQAPQRIKEEDFYQPFCDWLEKDIEECTKAIPLGRNYFHDKWGTPDVIGKSETRRSDLIQTPVEIVAAEIKLDTSQLVTAFGQACAYCLFAHKSYLVVPSSSPSEEIDKVDALCQVYGIGLVLYDSSNSKAPDFEIRVRPQKHSPDSYYINKYMKFVESELFS